MEFDKIKDILDITYGCWVNVEGATYLTEDRYETEKLCEGKVVDYITTNSRGELVIELVGATRTAEILVGGINMKKGTIVFGTPNRYFDKYGEEIHAGDFIMLNDNCHAEPEEVYEWEDEYGNKGLGIDATNPVWIEKGRAVPCEFGIYPLTTEDLEEPELVSKEK